MYKSYKKLFLYRPRGVDDYRILVVFPHNFENKQNIEKSYKSNTF